MVFFHQNHVCAMKRSPKDFHFIPKSAPKFLGFFFFSFFLLRKGLKIPLKLFRASKPTLFFLTFYFYHIYGWAKNQLQILKSLFKGPKPCALSVVGLKWVQEESFDCSLKTNSLFFHKTFFRPLRCLPTIFTSFRKFS